MTDPWWVIAPRSEPSADSQTLINRRFHCAAIIFRFTWIVELLSFALKTSGLPARRLLNDADSRAQLDCAPSALARNSSLWRVPANISSAVHQQLALAALADSAANSRQSTHYSLSWRLQTPSLQMLL
jgi:hypothetical protein